MKIKSIRFPALKTGRYHLAGGEGPVRTAWLVLHGYGQLAGPFLEMCAPLVRPGSLVIAPEGLSRFYRKGYFGDVGANWMTREARQDDILDNIRYLDGVLAEVFSGLGGPPEKLAVLGYSQGGPTAARWSAVAAHKVDDLVMFCSDFPRDIGDEALESLKMLRLWYVHASRDEFMDDELFRQQAGYLEEKGIRFGDVPFEGTHELDEEALKRLEGLVRGAD